MKNPYGNGYRVHSRKEELIAAARGWQIIDDRYHGGSSMTDVTSPKPPTPVLLRRGETVRVVNQCVLHNRVGEVSGFTTTDKGRLTFVSWPQGGWTTFYEDQLERVGKKGSKDGK